MLQIAKVQTYSYQLLLIHGYFNKPYENEIILREQNISSKYCQPIELLIYFGRRVRSLHTGNIRSESQRAAKSLAIKDGVLKKKSADSAITAKVCARAWPGFEYTRIRIIFKV